MLFPIQEGAGYSVVTFHLKPKDFKGYAI